MCVMKKLLGRYNLASSKSKKLHPNPHDFSIYIYSDELPDDVRNLVISWSFFNPYYDI